MSSIPTQIAETVQTAHLNRAPSPRHDLNPSTAASIKEPVRLVAGELDDDDDDIDIDRDEDEDDVISVSVLRRPRRRQSFPPMPDLRFEQSYLHSIRAADTWWKVGWITIRDQVMMPLLQGVLYNLAICGWQFWNKNAQYSGSSIGAKVRRWWYGVNNWPIPSKKRV
ncbi:hypothetical protein BX600DRAFT_509219 [Xylariales sp. PMI_506]|nr:hypothetical protein BX600DRAFT_509219 [Xylariales sp. PMI_506]